MGTARIIKFFDKLFDSVNGSTFQPRCGKPFSGGVFKSSGHKHFWKEAIKILGDMYFVDEAGKMVVPPCIKNWIATLEGFVDLHTILVEQGRCKYFLPRCLNQDVIENYFGKIRSQRNRATNLTAAQFKESFKSLLLRNFYSSNSVGANCEKTNIPDLFHIKGLVDKNINQPSVNETSYEILNVNMYISKLSPYNLEKDLHKSIVGYVSGWVAKTLRNLKCEYCKTQILNNFSEDEQCYKLIRIREYNCNNRKLQYCKLDFIKNINRIYNISRIVLNNCTSFDNIKNKISFIVSHHVKFSFHCEHKELIESEICNKIIYLTIFTFVKGLNLILSGRDTRVSTHKNALYQNACIMYQKKLKSKNRRQY